MAAVLISQLFSLFSTISYNFLHNLLHRHVLQGSRLRASHFLKTTWFLSDFSLCKHNCLHQYSCHYQIWKLSLPVPSLFHHRTFGTVNAPPRFFFVPCLETLADLTAGFPVTRLVFTVTFLTSAHLLSTFGIAPIQIFYKHVRQYTTFLPVRPVR